MKAYHTNDLALASDFQPLEGESNFGPTITREVVGGTHIAPHCITVKGGEYVLVDWAEGLPRHDKLGTRAVRFPHGLMLFGESFEDCAVRLIRDQLGMSLESMNVVHVYSIIDEMNHWHLEPILVTRVSGESRASDLAKIVTHPIGPSMPEHWKWWGKPPFNQTFEKYIGPFLGR
jgi:hypothetical protein